MKKIITTLFITILLISCNKVVTGKVTNKYRAPKRYKVYTYKANIYVDSITYHKAIELGNNGSIINHKYYIVFQGNNQPIEVNKNTYDHAIIGDSISLLLQ